MVYALTPKEVETCMEVDVTCKILVIEGKAIVQFDFEATNSFISSTYAQLCGAFAEPLDVGMVMPTLVWSTVVCRRVVWG